MELTATLLLAGLGHCQPNWHPREAGSPFCRIYYVKAGSAVYHDASNPNLPLQRNCVYIFPANKAYELTHTASDPLVCIYIHAICHSIEIKDPVEALVLPGTPLGYITAFIEAILKERGKQSDLTKAVDLLLMCINNQYQISALYSPELTLLLQYIEENLSGELTNQVMCQYVGYTRSYFVRWFKAGIAHTPQEYVHLRRMKRATELLVQGTSVEEVAGIVGYADSKAFSRSFRETIGVPPSQFKSRHFAQP